MIFFTRSVRVQTFLCTLFRTGKLSEESKTPSGSPKKRNYIEILFQSNLQASTLLQAGDENASQPFFRIRSCFSGQHLPQSFIAPGFYDIECCGVEQRVAPPECPGLKLMRRSRNTLCKWNKLFHEWEPRKGTKEPRRNPILSRLSRRILCFCFE